MEGVEFAFPINQTFQLPEISFFTPSDDTSCGSAYAKVADSEIFVSLSVFLSPANVDPEITSTEISIEFIKTLFKGLQLAIPNCIENDFLLFKIKVDVVQSGGSNDYALALCLNEIAKNATISLEERIKLFKNELQIQFTIFELFQKNGVNNGCNKIQRNQMSGEFIVQNIWKETWSK